MTKLDELAELGQAIWLDYIRRSFTRAGDLQALIDQGVRGVTSNPAIFEKAIAGSDDYDDDIKRLAGEDKSVNEMLEFRAALRSYSRKATTVGYGPRFLHSTGQLHKGDAGKGLFIQVTADTSQDVPIPDEGGSARSSMTFGTLKEAQALGDRQALLDGGRKVIRFHLGTDVIGGLHKLAMTLR